MQQSRTITFTLADDYDQALENIRAELLKDIKDWYLGNIIKTKEDRVNLEAEVNSPDFTFDTAAKIYRSYSCDLWSFLGILGDCCDALDDGSETQNGSCRNYYHRLAAQAVQFYGLQAKFTYSWDT